MAASGYERYGNDSNGVTSASTSFGEEKFEEPVMRRGRTNFGNKHFKITSVATALMFYAEYCGVLINTIDGSMKGENGFNDDFFTATLRVADICKGIEKLRNKESFDVEEHRDEICAFLRVVNRVDKLYANRLRYGITKTTNLNRSVEKFQLTYSIQFDKATEILRNFCA